MGREEYLEFLKVDHTGFYKQSIGIGLVVYFVAKRVVDNDSTDYNVIRTFLPSRITECRLSQHQVTIELLKSKWTPIDESEFLLSKIN
tara:strand:- start:1724 stop:1987 length:264 start_codon:yes stop_codon:yes gene_type:complete